MSRLAKNHRTFSALCFATIAFILALHSPAFGEDDSKKNSGEPSQPVSQLQSALTSDGKKIDREPFIIDRGEKGKPSQYIMRGMRYKNPKGPPVVLAHGFLNTYEMTEAWGRYLYEHGYDVWMFNQVGFGLEGEKSLAREYHHGDYEFDGVVKGVDLVVRHVYRETRKKVRYLSFSMGGMSYHQYISGMNGMDENGNPLRFKELAEARRKFIRSAVTIGAPPYRLTGLALPIRMAGELTRTTLNGLFKDVDRFVPIGVGGLAENAGDTARLGKLLDYVPIMRSQLLGDVVNDKHMGKWKDDLEGFLSRMFSPPHTDILRSFDKMSHHATENAYPAVTHVPELEIFGTRDGLASATELMERFKERTLALANDPNTRHLHDSAILMSDFSHLDMMLEDAIYNYGLGEQVLKFFADPIAFQGDEKRRFQILGPDHWISGLVSKRYVKDVAPIERDFASCLAARTRDALLKK